MRSRRVTSLAVLKVDKISDLQEVLEEPYGESIMIMSLVLGEAYGCILRFEKKMDEASSIFHDGTDLNFDSKTSRRISCVASKVVVESGRKSNSMLITCRYHGAKRKESSESLRLRFSQVPNTPSVYMILAALESRLGLGACDGLDGTKRGYQGLELR
ncbi:hypothetical protein Tco_0990279 [Tanacetum coccineum]|uniref:Uncharacterized protein n=1 Tax=Tanacetum coccineum TaxID=301880 RepID=A0ABQ5EW98_9ASTR